METIANWFQTYSGKLVSVTDPKPEDVDVVDVAHALSMTCRFGGHCRDFYSVAEHSVHVCEIGTALRSHLDVTYPSTIENTRHSLVLLLHDAAEAYVGDLITPLKRNLLDAKALETKWLKAIEQKFNLGTALSDPEESIKQADLCALSIEILSLYDRADPIWWSKFKPPTILDLDQVSIDCWSPVEARRRFLRLFTQLHDRLEGLRPKDLRP